MYDPGVKNLKDDDKKYNIRELLIGRLKGNLHDAEIVKGKHYIENDIY